jgi:hypothetical protein
MCPTRGDQLHPMPAAVDPLSQLSCPLRRSDCASHRSTRRAGSPRPAPRFWCGDPRVPLAWRCPTGTSAERSEPGISAFVGHWLPRVGLPTRPPDETSRRFAVHRCPDHPTRPVTSIQLLVRTQKAGRRARRPRRSSLGSGWSSRSGAGQRSDLALVTGLRGARTVTPRSPDRLGDASAPRIRLTLLCLLCFRWPGPRSKDP